MINEGYTCPRCEGEKDWDEMWCDECRIKAVSNYEAMDEYVKADFNRYADFVRWYYDCEVDNIGTYPLEMVKAWIRSEEGTLAYKEMLMNFVTDDVNPYLEWYDDNY